MQVVCSERVSAAQRAQLGCTRMEFIHRIRDNRSHMCLVWMSVMIVSDYGV